LKRCSLFATNTPLVFVATLALSAHRHPVIAVQPVQRAALAYRHSLAAKVVYLVTSPVFTLCS
jgi:hypothetical protein